MSAAVCQPQPKFVCLNLLHHRSGDNRFFKGHSGSIEVVQLLLRKTIQSHGQVSSISGLIPRELVLLDPDVKIRDIKG